MIIILLPLEGGDTAFDMEPLAYAFAFNFLIRFKPVLAIVCDFRKRDGMFQLRSCCVLLLHLYRF